jgi:adenylosuccinate synthase
MLNGEKIEHFPYDVVDSNLIPVYEEIEGWNCDLTQLNSYSEAPDALKHYVNYLEQKLEVPITVVSVGPDRKQTLENKH